MARLKNHSLIPIVPATPETIGERLARLRKEHGLTQEKLAEKLGVSRSVIMDYERDKVHVYDEIIIRLASVLDITTDELLGVKKNEKREYPSNLKNIQILKRMEKIAELPSIKQKKVLENLDLILKGIES